MMAWQSYMMTSQDFRIAPKLASIPFFGMERVAWLFRNGRLQSLAWLVVALALAGCNGKDGASNGGEASDLGKIAPLGSHSESELGESNQFAGEEFVYPEDPVELVNIGNQLLAEGRAATAIPFYARALDKTPQDEEVHFNLAYAFSRIGRSILPV